MLFWSCGQRTWQTLRVKMLVCWNLTATRGSRQKNSSKFSRNLTKTVRIRAFLIYCIFGNYACVWRLPQQHRTHFALSLLFLGNGYIEADELNQFLVTLLQETGNEVKCAVYNTKYIWQNSVMVNHQAGQHSLAVSAFASARLSPLIYSSGDPANGFNIFNIISPLSRIYLQKQKTERKLIYTISGVLKYRITWGSRDRAVSRSHVNDSFQKLWISSNSSTASIFIETAFYCPKPTRFQYWTFPVNIIVISLLSRNSFRFTYAAITKEMFCLENAKWFKREDHIHKFITCV